MNKTRLHISVTPDTLERLKQYAQEHHTTVSQSITDWIWSVRLETNKDGAIGMSKKNIPLEDVAYEYTDNPIFGYTATEEGTGVVDMMTSVMQDLSNHARHAVKHPENFKLSLNEILMLEDLIQRVYDNHGEQLQNLEDIPMTKDVKRLYKDVCLWVKQFINDYDDGELPF